MEEQEKKKEINRRDFLKIVGISGFGRLCPEKQSCHG